MIRGAVLAPRFRVCLVTFDDGESWQPLQNDLPHAPVSGIVVQEHFDDLVISTYGRGFWILDVASKEEAIEWARRCPNPMPGGGFVMSFTDITEFREAERALKDANEGLEQRGLLRAYLHER